MVKAKKTDVAGTPRRSAAQGRKLVAQWRSSGQSVTEFCRERSVGPHVLRYWLSREAGGTSGEDFFVVQAAGGRPSALGETASPTGALDGTAVIVVLPGAAAGYVAKTVQALLRETGS